MRHVSRLASATALVALALTTPAFSAVTINTYNYSSLAAVTSWPVPFSNASTIATAPPNTPGQYNSAESNYGTAATYSLAQSWTSTVTGNLSHVQILVSGSTPPPAFDLAIYDAVNGSQVWNHSVDFNYVPNSTGLNGVSADQLTGAADGLVWGGYTVPGSTHAVLDFEFTGADAIPIAGSSGSPHQYIFEISSSSNPTNLVWLRNASDSIQYVGGQAFRQAARLNGNANRDMTLAITVAVPEPTAIAGLAALGLTALARRRRA